MAGQGAIWIDGRRAEALPLPDRGLAFGDGLFETLLCQQQRPLLLDYHLERLQRGLELLGFPDLGDRVDQCLAVALDHRTEGDPVWSVLRLTVTRGIGPRGYQPPAVPEPRIVIELAGLERDCGNPLAPARLGEARLRWGDQPHLAGVKHLNRLEQVLVAMQCRDERLDELLVLDQSGRPVSVGSGNLFLARGGCLYTPPLDRCGIAGTRRRAVLERWAPRLGLEARERRIGLAELEQADEIFYCNALVGLRPVARFRDRLWRQHSLCLALFEQYRRELA